MKKLHKLAAAVAMAAGIALSPQVGAIEFKPNGVGDAMLFPAFNGYIENYFTISNHSNTWVQGHIRFRGAAWSAELRDFDVILSPGDVFVFRVADLDGDNLWEIDESLDKKNFEYTGMVHDCTGPAGTVPYCLDASNLLEPALDEKNGITQALIDHQRHVGYVEFIGESVLNGMTHAIMSALTSTTPGVWAPYVTQNGNARGTSAWKWSDAANGFRTCTGNNHPCDQGLLDVGNWLSGTAFVTIAGQTNGLAYNADVFTNFRTANFSHRIDNYVRTGVAGAANVTAGTPSAVILHHESADSQVGGPSPYGDYVYGCIGMGEPYDDELVISFNNTWGPTLADGDDTTGNALDGWDTARLNYIDSPPINVSEENSVDEVETAIEAAGQVYYSYYFHNKPFDVSKLGSKATLHSHFFAYFPTKFYYGESLLRARLATTKTCQDYINLTVIELLKRGKPLNIEVWDTEENNCTRSSGNISPARPDTVAKVLGHELNIFNVDWLKAGFNNPACSAFKSGRTVVQLLGNIVEEPGLMYTFEIGSDGALSQWRAMQR